MNLPLASLRFPLAVLGLVSLVSARVNAADAAGSAPATAGPPKIVVTPEVIAAAAAASAAYPNVPGFPPVHFDPRNPVPTVGTVRDKTTLTEPPPGYTAQRGDNFYLPRDIDPAQSLRRWAFTGHWSNYDETLARSNDYLNHLPDVLKLNNGQPVKDADTWYKMRRPEIIKLYETEIFGKVPANAPTVSWTVTGTVDHGTYFTKTVLGTIIPANGVAPAAPVAAPAARGGRGAGGPPSITITMNIPANAPGKVPVIFGGIGGSTQDILARGWAYGSINTGSIQQDSADYATLQRGVIGMAESPHPPIAGGPDDRTDYRAPDDWGVLRAWSWGYSRAMDYLETDKDVDSKQVAITGHSRFGKLVLLTGALDDRFAMVWASCSGQMGAGLSRRDWGETVDDMAQLFGPHFAGNFQKYAGHWDQLPVDSHFLIALMAPRPLFVTGGTVEQWQDVDGEFEAAVKASPVYELLGARGLNAKIDQIPGPEQPLMDGALAFNKHTGGHMMTATEGQLFLQMADRYFKVKSAAATAK